jgi:4-hydroxybenzoate polyprenyltransferase
MLIIDFVGYTSRLVHGFYTGPPAWGVCLGSAGVADPYLLLLFLMGSWTSRSAGCIFNDYLDRDFDKKV